MTFSNSDPAHAQVNPLRARIDKPHLWFQNGFWRVCPLTPPPWRTSKFNLWDKAHRAVILENNKLWVRAAHAPLAE